MNRLVGYASFLLIVVPAAAQAAPPVVVREESLTIPTWEVGPPSVHPLYPARQGPIYPYTLNDALTDRKRDQAYRAIFLENEYVQVLVLPELGGRVHGALDKTNGYVWLYWQRTIKPGLISMTGAWISGGIEWNFPHGHRPSGFMPVEHRTVRHPDGSATVWVGETEPVYGTRWLVGLTLEPGRSRLRCDYVLANPTSHRRSFQFWATSATHANEWAQAQYPGQVMTGHGKTEFWRWPLDHGVDLSWWKNVPNENSFFAWQSRDDWFGTYDHRAQAGTVHVADHRLMPGKKLWTWGSGPSGRVWEQILSEGGGPYFEPQAGAWSDNQPDYHWLEPGEVRTLHDYWYPVRGTRGFHLADPDFALNTDLRDGTAFGAVHATGVFERMRVALRDARDGRLLAETTARLAPDRPLALEAPVEGTTVYDLRLSLYDETGRLRLELQQRLPREQTLPAPVQGCGEPKDLSPDALFHCGEWLDRFRRTDEALRDYDEALRRDPADTRVNAELGFLALRQARWSEAQRRFETALARDADDPRLHYGLAQAALGLGRTDEGEDELARASRGPALAAAASLQLARLALRKGDVQGALAALRRAREQNDRLADIPALAAAARRRLAAHAEALAAAEQALERDPLHAMAAREQLLALRALGRPSSEAEATLESILHGAVQGSIDLAAAYAEAGLFDDADAVLVEAGPSPSPMVSYLRGFLRQALGDAAGAAQLLRQASTSPLAGALPHRLLEQRALESALAANPQDAAAHHLLGNLLYGLGQREEGLARWEQAVAVDPRLALAWRNVGYAEAQLHRDDRAALAAYDRAFVLDPTDARVLLERDQTAERAGSPAAERLALLERHRGTVEQRDDLVQRWIDLRLDAGDEPRLAEVARVLDTRHFRVWEGAYGLQLAFVEVEQKLGEIALARGDRRTALVHYERAAEYPKNLEVAPRTPDLRAHVLVPQAQALGRGPAATALLERALAERYPRPSLGTYYQALAARALGREADATARLDALEKQASSDAADASASTRAIGHYLLSLVWQERGDRARSAAERTQARALDPRPQRLALTRAQVEYAQARP